MKYLKFALPGLVLAGGLIVNTTVSHAKPAYSTKEKKACTYCHVKQGSKDLNATGECYKTNNHSLATCPAPPAK